MSYTRRISATDAVDAGYPGYQVEMVASPESATVLAGFLGTGGHPPLHTHEEDLFFVVLEGSTTLRLGHGSHQAKAGEVIYVPAGLPHGSDNQSGAAELHLEILIPGVPPGRPFLKPVGNLDEVQMPAAAPHVASTSGPATETTGHKHGSSSPVSRLVAALLSSQQWSGPDQRARPRPRAGTMTASLL